MFKDYIKEVIDTHQRAFGIVYHKIHRDEIESYISKGIYAFQIIYDTLPDTVLYVIDLIKPLDYKLCVYESNSFDIWGAKKMWSYDGGQRYQWSEMETLIFDSSIIRDIKIKSLLNN
jgi:hypothetical protein